MRSLALCFVLLAGGFSSAWGQLDLLQVLPKDRINLVDQLNFVITTQRPPYTGMNYQRRNFDASFPPMPVPHRAVGRRGPLFPGIDAQSICRISIPGTTLTYDVPARTVSAMYRGNNEEWVSGGTGRNQVVIKGPVVMELNPPKEREE